jgi:uncharacterized protein
MKALIKRMSRPRRRRLMEIEKEVLAEIRMLRDSLRHTSGVVVAGVDGLLVAHDSNGVEPENMAALAAAHLGLSQRLTHCVAHGAFQETVTRGENGYVATFAAGTDAVLMVLAGPDLNVGRLHLEARPVAARVGALVARATGPPPPTAPAPAPAPAPEGDEPTHPTSHGHSQYPTRR